jgi:hypothetical protein
MSELFIRPSFNDHNAVGDLLYPTAFSADRSISRLVLNPWDAARQAQFGELAAKSGTPIVIDPMTPLFQSEVGPQDAWVKHVPYGKTEAVAPSLLVNPFVLEQIVAEVVEFQVEQGATLIVPPYFYATTPDSDEFRASLAAIGRTARRLRRNGVALPIMPLLCAQLRGFLHQPHWRRALDEFLAAAVEVGPQAIAFQFSPAGSGPESYSKILDLVVGARHLRSAGIPTYAWRQGVYGQALVAAGLDGYECGMGIGEYSDVKGSMSNHKPAQGPPGGFSSGGVFISTLGRSVPSKVARILLDERSLKGRLVCDSIRCCPHGVESMCASKGRLHAVRARSRRLQELDAIPSGDWRLHHVGKEAAGAYVAASKANEVLEKAGSPNRIKLESYASLEQVTDFLRAQGVGEARNSA